MKSILTICITALLVFAVMPATSVAQPQVEVYMDDPLAPGTWPTVWAPGDDAALARLFRVGSAVDSACNKRLWTIDMTIHASVAQWVSWSLTWQGWQWYIKKPGCYAGDCIEFNIASNGDIQFDYVGFSNLTADVPNQQKEEIETFYSFGADITTAEANGWISAADLALQGSFLDETLLNGDGIILPNLHVGISYKLWTKVCVETCNTACEYSADGSIVIELKQQKTWLDDNGDWLIG